MWSVVLVTLHVGFLAFPRHLSTIWRHCLLVDSCIFSMESSISTSTFSYTPSWNQFVKLQLPKSTQISSSTCWWICTCPFDGTRSPVCRQRWQALYYVYTKIMLNISLSRSTYQSIYSLIMYSINNMLPSPIYVWGNALSLATINFDGTELHITNYKSSIFLGMDIHV